MSQIDKIIYIPLLFWFIILIVILYFIIFSYFFSIFLTILKVRIIFYKEVKNNCILKYKHIIYIYLQNSILFICFNIFNINYINRLNILKNI